MNLKTKITAAILASMLAVTGVSAVTAIASTTAQAATTLTGSITIDTANYKMDKNNIYDIGITVKKGNEKLSGEQVKALVSKGIIKVEDSRTGSIVDLTQLNNGNFRVKGKNYGTTYITYRIMNGTTEVNHASVKIDVEKGVKQGGTSTRNTSVFDESLIGDLSSLNTNTSTNQSNFIGEQKAIEAATGIDISKIDSNGYVPYEYGKDKKTKVEFYDDSLSSEELWELYRETYDFSKVFINSEVDLVKGFEGYQTWGEYVKSDRWVYVVNFIFAPGFSYAYVDAITGDILRVSTQS